MVYGGEDDDDIFNRCSGPVKRILGSFSQVQYNPKPKYQV